jgi:hypothetical protein
VDDHLDARRRVAGSYDVRAGSVELALRRLLPPQRGKSSTERLMGIAGKALDDGSRALKPPLSPQEREDAHQHLLEVGVKSIDRYDPSRDRGHLTVPLDERFGGYAYFRMRFGLVDWLRANRGDRRRVTQMSVEPSSHLEGLGGDEQSPWSALVEEDFSGRVASHLKVERYKAVADASGMSLGEWAIARLDVVMEFEEDWWGIR